MPLNDEMKHQGEDLIKDHASGDASVASVLPDDHAAVAEEINANEAIADPLSPDCGMPQEFTFFQKKETPRSSWFGANFGVCKYSTINSLCRAS